MAALSLRYIQNPQMAICIYCLNHHTTDLCILAYLWSQIWDNIRFHVFVSVLCLRVSFMSSCHFVSSCRFYVFVSVSCLRVISYLRVVSCLHVGFMSSRGFMSSCPFHVFASFRVFTWFHVFASFRHVFASLHVFE